MQGLVVPADSATSMTHHLGEPATHPLEPPSATLAALLALQAAASLRLAPLARQAAAVAVAGAVGVVGVCDLRVERHAPDARIRPRQPGRVYLRALAAAHRERVAARKQFPAPPVTGTGRGAEARGAVVGAGGRRAASRRPVASARAIPDARCSGGPGPGRRAPARWGAAGGAHPRQRPRRGSPIHAMPAAPIGGAARPATQATATAAATG